jgi:hypothetical protein
MADGGVTGRWLRLWQQQQRSTLALPKWLLCGKTLGVMSIAMTQALSHTLALATLTCPRSDSHPSASPFSRIHAGITWELASKFEGKLSSYKVLLDDFVASMLRSSWGKGKTYPFERLPGNKLDKSVISKPGELLMH